MWPRTRILVVPNSKPVIFKLSDMVDHSVLPCMCSPKDSRKGTGHPDTKQATEGRVSGLVTHSEQKSFRWVFLPLIEKPGTLLAECVQLCFCRREAEEELNQKLSWLEAQHAACCESLSLQHQCEKDQLLQTHLQRVKDLAAQLALEKGRREEREQEVLAHCRRQQLKLQAVMSEEQARICRSFTLEKEKLEQTYREQVEGLAQEADVLRALLKNGTTVLSDQQERTPSSMTLGPDSRQEPPAWQAVSPDGRTEAPAEWPGLGRAEGRDLPGQPCSIDAIPSPTLTRLSRRPSENLGVRDNHQGPLSAEEGAIPKEPEPSARTLTGQGQKPLPIQPQMLEPWLGPASLDRKPASVGVHGQASEGPTRNGDGVQEAWLQFKEEAARMRPSVPCSELPKPQEAKVMSESEMNDVKTKLLQLEDVVRALEKADFRESHRFVTPNLKNVYETLRLVTH